MRPTIRRSCATTFLFCGALIPAQLRAQADKTPIRKTPTQEFLVNAGVRDWGPATVVGNTVVAGGPTGGGGLFVIDGRTGKLRWTFRPVGINGSVSTPPAVAGDLAIAPFGAANPGAVVAMSLTTGKEVWRGPDPATGSGVTVSGDLVYALDKQGGFHAMALATGHDVWKVAFTKHRAPCATQPIVRDGTVYLMAEADATPGDSKKPAGYYLFALDAKSGQEQWRFRADAPYVTPGACLTQPVITPTTIYSTGEQRLWAIDRVTGRARWASIEIRQTVEGRDRPVDLSPLVEGGDVLIAMSDGYITGFAESTGKVIWQLAGRFDQSRAVLAVAGNVLYFQGSPGADATAPTRGTLHALELGTRAELWSFSRPTAQPGWGFGSITPVDGGLWADSYMAMVKLHEGP